VYQGLFAIGKMDSYFPLSVVITRLATFAAKWISASNSAPLKDVSHLASHLAVRIATIRQVPMRSDCPIFGQSARRPLSPSGHYKRTEDECILIEIATKREQNGTYSHLNVDLE
jgi:hypothetical protein